MDSDSYLNLSSDADQHLNIDEDYWCTMIASTTNSSNPKKDVPWFDSPSTQQQQQHHHKLEISDSASSLPTNNNNNTNQTKSKVSSPIDSILITENASHQHYTSVLRLSAVVSALPSFSSTLHMSKPASSSSYNLNSSASFISRGPYNRGSKAKVVASPPPPRSVAKDHDGWVFTNGEDGETFSSSGTMNPPNLATFTRDGDDDHGYTNNALNTQIYSKEKEEEEEEEEEKALYHYGGMGAPIGAHNGPTIPRGWLKEKATRDKRLGGEEFDDVIEVKPPISNVIIVRRPSKTCPSNHDNNIVTSDDRDDGVGDHPKRIKREYPHDHDTTFMRSVGRTQPSTNAQEEGLSTREAHILSERHRRKSMRESFTILQSLVPKLHRKHLDRITVLTEVITYIKSLRGVLKELEQKKIDALALLGIDLASTKSNQELNTQERTHNCNVTYIMEGTHETTMKQVGGEVMVEVTVRFARANVFITLNIPRKKGVWTGVLKLLHKCSIEISNASLTTIGDSGFHSIHGKITNMAHMKGVDLQDKLETVIVKELKKNHQSRR